MRSSRSLALFAVVLPNFGSLKILGLISSPDDPASRARILQYHQPLATQDIQLDTKYFSPLRNDDPAPWTYRFKKFTGVNEWRASNTSKLVARLPLLVKQHQYDIIWQNRLLLPHHVFFEKRFSKPLVFDFDDAIWLDEGQKEVASVIAMSKLVFAGNEYLADFARKYNSQVYVIPTTVNTEQLHPLKKDNDEAVFNIGWMGSRSNFIHLALALPAINDFLDQHHDAKCTIVSSIPPPGIVFDDKRFVFKQWSPETEQELLNTFSIGIMPLEDNLYTRGKCAYKMLQYMSCGKAVIVSPVGLNKDIMQRSIIGLAANDYNEWLKNLTILKNDIAMRNEMGKNGRELVVKDFDMKTWSVTLSSLFKSLA